MNKLDERISAALHASVDGLREQDLRPAEPPVGESRGRKTIRWAAPLLTAAAVAAAIVTTFALTGSPSASHQQQPGGPTSPPAPSPTKYPPSTYAPSAVQSKTPVLPGPELGGDLPLWPFANGEQAQQWQTVDGPNGHSPWHADAKLTALSFATGYLHFHDITEVTTVDIQATEANIGVGYDLPSGDKHTASVIHLARYGGENAPWEVVGAAASDFTITEPTYGDGVTSPLTVGGRITGVDETISVAVRTIDGSVDTVGPVPAGGQDAPWTMTVPFSERGVATIVAWTGGSLTAHGRFAVVGVKAGT
jgi:hypothetical protein